MSQLEIPSGRSQSAGDVIRLHLHLPLDGCQVATGGRIGGIYGSYYIKKEYSLNHLDRPWKAADISASSLDLNDIDFGS